MEVLNTDPRQLSPLNLAFIGDCVYEMQVRCHLVALANRPVNDLHRESVKFVSAKAQTAAFARMEPLLTEEELAAKKETLNQIRDRRRVPLRHRGGGAVRLPVLNRPNGADRGTVCRNLSVIRPSIKRLNRAG